MLPYVVTMIVLVLTSKKSRAPKAEGIPLRQGQPLTAVAQSGPARMERGRAH